MQKQEPSGEVPDISVSGSQGVFAGSGNQYNTWAQKLPLDPAALGGLNPHVAVARLQQLSHDELVDFFAKAKPDDVVEIIEAFVESHHIKVMAVLGDINRRKATELIDAVCAEYDSAPLKLLKALPEAGEAIARKAANLRWTSSGLLEWVGGGYARRYKGGCVFWSDDFGVRTSTGLIDGYLIGAPECGVAIGDQETAPTSPYGANGTRQDYRSGGIYSSTHGTFWVSHNEEYERDGGSGGWLGFPIGETGVIPGYRWFQRFEGGIRSSNPRDRMDDPIAVRNEVLKLIQPFRYFGFPVSQEQSFGANGHDCFQFFENGVVTLRGGKREIWLRPDSNTGSPIESDTTATPKNTPALPLADYDELSFASLRARLRNLSVEQLKQLIDYELSHAVRIDVVTMFTSRIAKLSNAPES